MTIVWAAIAGADFYEVERMTGGGPWVVVGVTTGSTFTDPPSNVTPETVYDYRVRAFAGELVESNVVEAATEGGVAPLTVAGMGLAAVALFYGAYRLNRGRNGGTA